jgi:hypothetical protein
MLRPRVAWQRPRFFPVWVVSGWDRQEYLPRAPEVIGLPPLLRHTVKVLLVLDTWQTPILCLHPRPPGCILLQWVPLLLRLPPDLQYKAFLHIWKEWWSRIMQNNLYWWIIRLTEILRSVLCSLQMNVFQHSIFLMTPFKWTLTSAHVCMFWNGRRPGLCHKWKSIVTYGL